jgi:homogentisate 1,2-dioxygenase
MPYYRRVGDVPPKRHTQHRDSSSRLYYEELVGEEGFSADSTLVYHRGVPSSLVDAREWDLPDQTTTPNHPLLPRHLRLHSLFDADQPGSTDVVTGRRLVLANADVRISYAVAAAPSALYRNAVGDECVYVESGTARVETTFGALDVGEGDYVILPRATTHRWLPTGADPLRAYVIEANGHIAPPKRYLSRYGQFQEHAPYCERDLRAPTDVAVAEDAGDVEVYVKHRGRGPGGLAGTVHVLPQHPFDVVGWDGCLYPVCLQRARLRADHRPGTSTAAGPPGVRGPELRHLQLRAAQGRLPPARGAGALLPLERRQRRGDVLLRRRLRGPQGSGIAQGSISLHPGGHSHGPQPGAIERSLGAEFFDELAVMVDTFRPLDLGEGASASDDGAYAWSWSGRGPAR